MPYAVKYDGLYLKRSSNAPLTRRLVPKLDDASTWALSGHAKNAAREAFKAGVFPSHATVEIVAVMLVELRRVGAVTKPNPRAP